jgi:hypothetical protein
MAGPPLLESNAPDAGAGGPTSRRDRTTIGLPATPPRDRSLNDVFNKAEGGDIWLALDKTALSHASPAEGPQSRVEEQKHDGTVSSCNFLGGIRCFSCFH